MALKYAVKSGDWSGSDVWGTQLTGTLDFTNGSADVTGSGTAFTTELSAGDKIFGADGVWYEVSSITDDTHLTLTTNYGGATATGQTSYKQVSYPVEGDNAVINSGVTVSLDNESGVVTVGDDTGTALTINGTLQYTSSATNDVTLRLKGHCKTNSGGDFLIGTSSNPIENTTFKIEANYSASLSTNKYYFDFENVTFYGSARTNWEQTLSANITVGDVSFTVTETGWQVGDKVVVFSSDNEEGTEVVEITGTNGSGTYYIDSNGDGTGNSPSFAYNHNSGDYALNLFRTVQVVPYDESYPYSANYDNYNVNLSGVFVRKANYFRYKTGNLNNVVFLENGTFDYWDKDTVATPTISCVFVNSKTGSVYYKYFDSCYFVISGYVIDAWQQTSCYHYNCKFLGGANTGYSSIRNMQNSLFSNCLFWNTHNIRIWYNGKFVDCTFKKYNNDLWHSERATGGNYYFKNCTFEDINGDIFGFNNNNYIWMEDCTFTNVAGSAFNFSFTQSSTSWDYQKLARPIAAKISSTGKYFKVLNGEVMDGDYAGVVGRTGNCLVLNPQSTSEYMEAYIWGRDDREVLNDDRLFFTSFPVNSGKTITLSFYIKVSATGFDGDLQIAAEGCGINYSWTSVDLTGADADWVQRSFTLGTTTDKGFVRLKIRAKDGATVSGDIYLDDFAITES